MILDDVHRGIHKHKPRKRVGRGPGSGHGKTSTRGHKGAGSRSGYSKRLSFEGGQMPLARRIAKRGFNNKFFQKAVQIVNLSALERAFGDGETVDPESLSGKGIVNGRYDEIKILGNGELSKKLTVRAHQFSKRAAEKIAAAGGVAESLGTE